MGFESVSESRRLDEHQVAFLRVNVQTRRHSQEDGNALLISFLPDTEIATQLLGFQVHGVEHVTVPVDTSNLPSMTSDTDPYAPAYEALEKGAGGSAIPGSPSEFLPAEAIIGIAAGVLVFGTAFVVFLLWRRWRAKKNKDLAAAKGKGVDNESVEDPKVNNKKEPIANQI